MPSGRRWAAPIAGNGAPSDRWKARPSATWSQSGKTRRARSSAKTKRVRLGDGQSSSPACAASRSNAAGVGEHVAEPVGHVGDPRLKLGQERAHRRADVQARRGSCCPAGSGAVLRCVAQVLALGGIEPERVGERVDHRRRRVAVTSRSILTRYSTLTPASAATSERRSPRALAGHGPPGGLGNGGVPPCPQEITQWRAHASRLRRDPAGRPAARVAAGGLMTLSVPSDQCRVRRVRAAGPAVGVGAVGAGRAVRGGAAAGAVGVVAGGSARRRRRARGRLSPRTRGTARACRSRRARWW